MVAVRRMRRALGGTKMQNLIMISPLAVRCTTCETCKKEANLGALYTITGIVFEQDMGKRKWPNPIYVLVGGWWDRPSHHVTYGSPPDPF